MANNKKKLLMVGGSGLVGSRIKELLESEFDIANFSLENGVNITDASTLSPLIEEAPATVFHLAAKADVDGCEKDKEQGEEGGAWKINVVGTQNVLKACEKAGHKMIYVSTDFVFDGDTTPEGGYSEQDIPNPQNWYAQTKFEGENNVLRSSDANVVMRIAYPYRSEFSEKLDFVRAILARLQSHQEVKAVTDHIMTPTFIDDIALGVKTLIDENASGIYHVVGSSSVSPYDAVSAIARVFSIANPSITRATRAEFFSGRAPRPFDLTLKNDRIKNLHVPMHTFDEGLVEMKSQMAEKGLI